MATHYMEAYRTAMLAAVRLQFTRRGSVDGRAGVRSMLQGNPTLRELLAAEG